MENLSFNELRSHELNQTFCVNSRDREAICSVWNVLKSINKIVCQQIKCSANVSFIMNIAIYRGKVFDMNVYIICLANNSSTKKGLEINKAVRNLID